MRHGTRCVEALVRVKEVSMNTMMSISFPRVTAQLRPSSLR